MAGQTTTLVYPGFQYGLLYHRPSNLWDHLQLDQPHLRISYSTQHCSHCSQYGNLYASKPFISWNHRMDGSRGEFQAIGHFRYAAAYHRLIIAGPWGGCVFSYGISTHTRSFC